MYHILKQKNFENFLPNFGLQNFEISKFHSLNRSPKAKKSIFLNLRVPEFFFEMF